MTGLPPHIEAMIAGHLDKIKAPFIAGTKVTVVIRPPLGPGKDGDVLMTDDDAEAVIATIRRRTAA